MLDGSRPSVSQAHVPGASASSSATPLLHVRTPTPPTVPAPPIPRDGVSPFRDNAPSPEPHRSSTTHFSTVQSEVRSGAIRMDITHPEQWSAGDVAVIRNQEAKKVRDIGSLIFKTPIQHDYEPGVEVRSLLSSEQLEEIDARLAVLDVNPSTGARFVRFWVDEVPLSDVTESHDDRGPATIPVMSRNISRTPVAPERREGGSPIQRTTGEDRTRESPDFGGGVDYHDYDDLRRERIPVGGSSSAPGGNFFPITKGQCHLRGTNPELPLKIKTRRDALCILWNHCEIGFVEELT